MDELVTRYVHQVGRYLPPGERAEIEAELRSQIEDKLDDRFEAPPTREQVAAVLAEMGHPYLIAASYGGDRAFIGPVLYPYLMLVLRRVWLIVPTIAVFLSVFGALTAPQPPGALALLIEAIAAAAQWTLIVTAIVVLFFAALERTVVGKQTDEHAFDPLDLPAADDPAAVDRFEAVFGIALSIVILPVFLHFARVGGLTLRLDPAGPSDIIPVASTWLLALVVVLVAILAVQVLVLRRSRWSAGLWLVETALELIGTVVFYFAITRPLVDRLIAANPDLPAIGLIARAPELFAVASAVLMLIGRGSTLVRLVGAGSGTAPPSPAGARR